MFSADVAFRESRGEHVFVQVVDFFEHVNAEVALGAGDIVRDIEAIITVEVIDHIFKTKILAVFGVGQKVVLFEQQNRTLRFGLLSVRVSISSLSFSCHFSDHYTLSAGSFAQAEVAKGEHEACRDRGSDEHICSLGVTGSRFASFIGDVLLIFRIRDLGESRERIFTGPIAVKSASVDFKETEGRTPTPPSTPSPYETPMRP